MARISTYVLDTNVTKDDKVIGTDSAGSITKNFSLTDISAIANQEITVAGQLVYQFRSNVSEGSLTGLSDGDGFSSVSSFRLSEVDIPGHNVENFLQEYKKKRVLIVDISNKNKYGIYDVLSIQEDQNNSNYYIFTFDYHGGNGSFVLENYYIFSLYSQDATYKHSQPNVSSTWDVIHNLNKFPSVSVTLSTGKQGYADVTYTNKNSLTINFSAPKSGSAFLN
jgi:hypothetical protein